MLTNFSRIFLSAFFCLAFLAFFCLVAFGVFFDEVPDVPGLAAGLEVEGADEDGGGADDGPGALSSAGFRNLPIAASHTAWRAD